MGEDSKLTIALEELAAGTYDFSKMSEDAWADVDWSVAYDNLA